jgi:hypothetical protein
VKRVTLLAVVGFLFFVTVLMVSVFRPTDAVTLVVAPMAMAQEEATPILSRSTVEIPFFDDWFNSGHADITAEAFRHWDEDDPAEVPVRCARCHSSYGYLDYIGADGTKAGVVDSPAEIGSVISCTTCHNDTTVNMSSVVMPSGIELTDLGSEARCMQCHQGRQSGINVDKSIEEAMVTSPDVVSEELGFLNIHYYAAAATKYGTLAKGGYEYEGKSYDAFFAHVDDFRTCTQCHDPHTLEVRVESCNDCHGWDIWEVEHLRDIRMEGSLVDFDGDGNIKEGIYYELEGLRDILYVTMQAYASQISGTAIIYDGGSYPYFFIDTNADSEVDEGEVTYGNRYNAWTARLVMAAYNYQVSLKDPGAFAHGGKYIIQLLYDSIEDLTKALDTGGMAAIERPELYSPVPATDTQWYAQSGGFSGEERQIIASEIELALQSSVLDRINRIDAGHFAGSEEAFRHWDEDGEVPGRCAKCHTAGGLPMFLEEGTTISQPPANGFQCTTCHDDVAGKGGSVDFTRYEVEEVTFPSGAVISSDYPDMNLCLSCHQGRESTVSVNALTRGINDDTVSERLRFLNIHYFAAGATRYGAEVQGAYQYTGKSYVGFFEHEEDFGSCLSCHDTHNLKVDFLACNECHEPVTSMTDLRSIREYVSDFDGDGDTDEGVFGEIVTMRDKLYQVLQEYSTNVIGTPLVYNGDRYPYYFADADADGLPGIDDSRFNSWTPRLLRAAYNYQYVLKDPGGYTHNAHYLLQVLYDSLEDLGADVGNMVRFDPENSE